MTTNLKIKKYWAYQKFEGNHWKEEMKITGKVKQQ